MIDTRGALNHPKTTLLAAYAVPDFLIDTVDLVFLLDEAACVVKSRLILRRNPASANPSAPLVLQGEKLALLRIALNETELESSQYHLTPDDLTLDAALLAGQSGEFQLDIEARIEPQHNTELSGLYKSGGNFTTQCEAEGFRRITWFLDRPDVMARYTTTIVADQTLYPVLLSNGNPVDRGTGRAGQHWVKWVDPHPKPSYLFALVAGDLVAVTDDFTTADGRAVDLAIYVRRGDEDKCAHAMRSLKSAMRWDEEVYGLCYDLDVFNIVAVSDFNMGAMENKGLNIFNTKYVLARPDTATDIDYQGIESVIAHEYFHNWTGNRVTCRDWFQLSLKEGLTVFRDQEFSADQGSPAVRRIGDVRALRAGQFPEDDGPLAHPVRPDSYIEINNFYTATVYSKGAEIVRMIRTLIGRQNFRRGMDLYFARHDNSAVTIEDFVAAMQDASGVDLGRFKQWYAQAGTPEIEVDESFDAESRQYRLTIRQYTKPTPGQPDKHPLVIPLAMGLLDPHGRELPTRLAGETAPSSGTRILTVTEAEQDFLFEGLEARPVPSLLRGFSAPVKLKGVPPERLKFLARYDTDPFARWEAFQQWATQLLNLQIAAIQQQQVPVLDPDFIAGFAGILAESPADPALAAQTLSLPSEAFLADQQQIIDVDAIHAARNYTRSVLGRELAAEFARHYQALTDLGEIRLDGPAMGRRALRNLCLAYLAAPPEPAGIQAAKAQFDQANSMTDALAALAVLVDYDAPESRAALAQFYAQWQNEELVIDKWFSLQAMAGLPDMAERCRDLMRHPAFDLKNPNRARSVIASFAMANPTGFHARSGAGYRFLADQVITLDAINGQMAARMVGPLGTWRRQDPARQQLMQAELRRVLASTALSKGTYEQASKCLS